LATKDYELLPEESVLGDEISFAARQVGDGADHHRMTRGLHEMQKGLFKDGDKTTEQLGQPMKKGEHVVGLQKKLSKTINRL
jgi:hypothetical protein